MNKSKFLKRSLATLLAILMVVAMVPSAFAAAGDPDVIKIGGEEAKFDGEKYTVSLTLPSGTSGIVENTLKALVFELRSENGTTVAIFDKDGKMIGTSLTGRPDISTAKKTVDVWAKSTRPTDSLWGDYTGMQLRVTTKGNAAVSYPLTISVSQRHASADTTLAAVESTRIVNYEIDEATKTVTIIKPIGVDDTRKKLGLTKDSFKPTNKNATVTVTPASGDTTAITSITVIAEDKSQQKYDVTYKVEKIFESFGVKDVEVLNTVTETEDSTTKGQVNMTVKVPYGTKASEIIPVFTPTASVKTIRANKGSNPGFDNPGSVVDLYDATVAKTTSGVANWVNGYGTASDDAGAHAVLASGQKLSFTMDVRTSVSSNKDTNNLDNTGKVVVTFIPVKNPEAKLKGVKVSVQSWGTSGGAGSEVLDSSDNIGTPAYNQVIANVDGTYPDIYVGDINNDQLDDRNNANNAAAVIARTCRDVKLFVSADSKVTWVNHYDGYSVSNITGTPGTFEQIDTTQAGDDYTVEFKNVDLRKVHNDYMHIKVESEDGSDATDYYITFNGTPSGDPEIYSVTLHGTTNVADATGTRDSDGNIIIHVPYDANLIDVNTMGTAFSTKYPNVSISASNGTTTAALSIRSGGVHGSVPVTEKSPISSLGLYATSFDGGVPTDSPNRTKFYFALHTSYDSTIADGTACASLPDDEFETKVFIIVDPASPNAVISSLEVTNQDTLLKSWNEVYTATINPDTKAIRVEVPFSFGKTNGVYSPQPIWVYKWDFNGTDVATGSAAGTDKGTYDFDFAELDEQGNAGTVNKELVAALQPESITTAAGESTFDYKTNGEKVYVWSEEAHGTSVATTTQTDTYYLYAVRQPANDAHELTNVSSTDPKVSVALDTAVPSLNRWIITVPDNYDSKNGVSQAPEFELTFDRSEKSTVKNGNNTWVAADKTSAAFKVAGGNLYFKNEKVTVTDGRVIHFTVVAEDGRATGEYEFVIGHAEPSSDATLASVKVDDEVSFVADGTNYVVKDLSEDENYDVTKLPVIIETTDPGASVTVDGKAYIYSPSAGTNITVDLSEGKTATVEVTAADGTTKATYTLSMSDGTTPPTPWTNPFKDVKESDWFYDAVKYVSQNDLMVGDPSGRFNPRSNLTRAEFAQILYKNEGNPDATWTNKFSDVKESDWYAKQIIWASEEEILAGYPDGKAHPRDSITREQLASLLWRYKGSPAPTGTALNFSDAASVNSYAKDAMIWAVENGIMQGNNNKLNPKGNATRAEAAQMLMQFFKNN